MSLYVHGFDDENHDCYIECEIDYECDEGYWDQVPGGYSYQRYFVDGEIIIESVAVLFVEYYDPDGNIIARIERKNMQEDALKALDRRVGDYVYEEVINGEPLSEDLWENRG